MDNCSDLNSLRVPYAPIVIEGRFIMTIIRNLLLIDTSPVHAQAFQEALLNSNDGPFHGDWVQTLAQSVEPLREKTIWAVFTRMSLGDSEGTDTVEKLVQVAPDVPILVMGSDEEEELCTEALRRGAKDYLLESHIDAYAFRRAIRNMAERKKAEEVLFTEKERASVTLNSIGDAVLSTDTTGKVTYLNTVAEKLTGWTREEACGLPIGQIFRIVDGVTREPVRNPLDLAVQQNKTVGLTANCILIRRDGYETAIEDSAAPIHDRNEQVTGAVIVFHDVGVARAIAAQMAHLAQHDILTDLPNRLLLIDRLSQAITLANRNRQKIAVLFLDLDGFKQINDSFGHATGDKLLRSVAARLSACVRDSDTVGRLGGDEFVVLLSGMTQQADVAVSAKKILAALPLAYQVDGHNLTVTASIGLSTYPDDGLDAEALIGNADRAMYRVKANGRNNYRFYEAEMDADVMAGHRTR
jgi:diguanylate cyclase (GGDEF)-like protein/PAS domain S-box-containing protein